MFSTLARYFGVSVLLQVALAGLTGFMTFGLGVDSGAAFAVSLAMILVLDYLITSVWVFDVQFSKFRMGKFLVMQTLNWLGQSALFVFVSSVLWQPWSVWLTTAIFVPVRFVLSRSWVYK